ncbi:MULTISPECIES: type II toxin-antitoxin system PrlF family antitoxin [unclassified Pseudomonas]|uniref:type II toxin-antitoxin system PrlF family antitoxin n=1 Tax=unclassified Pseudomonas TaxID=196821 RepID=UPI00119EDCB2|nr:MULTISPECIES: type II toxin-antitoxin system PrlF family antitoxin [unclassified Pseudomonas]TWC22280.1 PrlF antitoxin of toxin-antitoxin system YhaV/PrlF [Pseudomonas sp. SJZ083]TWC48735.1 PrlF antitoxin of toxin-antitoxin system YhaV/PrlF [Pseudomonas sp. SJZ077]
MNDPRIPMTSTRRVQSETAPVLTEPMEAHHSVSQTLELLATDMNAHPEHIRPVDSLLVDRIIALVGQMDVDLNTPLLAEDE